MGSEIIGGAGLSQIIGANGADPESAYRSIAAGLLGTLSLDWYFTHFTSSTHGLSAVPVNTGTATLSVTGETSGPGWLKLSSGAGASSQGGMQDAANSALTQSKPWYTAVRFRMTTVPAAGTQAILGLRDTGTGALLGGGIQKALVAANFCAFNGYAAADLGVPFDTLYHVIESWGPGGASCFSRIDGGASVSFTNAQLQTGAANHYLAALNGGTAADQTAIVDWFCTGGAVF